MRFRTAFFLATALMLMDAGAGYAQSLPSLGSGGASRGTSGLDSALSGGAAGLVGQALPNVSSAGTANTTGVLSYCIKNNYLKGDAASSLLGNLSGRSGVQSSKAFSAGQQGNLETGDGNMFSISGLKDKAKSKLCDMVMQHAQSLF